MFGGNRPDRLFGLDVAINLDNTGTIGINVAAAATGVTDAVANAQLTYGIAQSANLARRAMSR